MKELIVSHPEQYGDRLSATITLGGRGLGDRARVVYFETSESVGSEGDFLLPLTLPPAMVTDSHLKLPGSVSPLLLSTLPKLQELLCLWGTENWGAKFQRVPVHVEQQSAGAEPASGVGCLFSGGLDSFYTLLKNRDKVTHLIFVHGFDITLANRSLRQRASHAAGEVARELGKNLIEVETNLRSFSDPLINWDQYHGAALASVGLLFQHLFREVLIPASFTYAELFPWGTHPLLDPLWSTDLTHFEHDGCEATRVDKAAYISNSEAAMRWLRVCWVNPHSAYNCGRCAKCRLTMMNLRAAGALGRCRTLPDTIDFDVRDLVKTLARMQPLDDSAIAFARQNINALNQLAAEKPPLPYSSRRDRPAYDLKRRSPKMPDMGRLVRREEPSAELREVFEPAEWDAAVKALGGSITQSWRWGLFQQRKGWKPLRLLDEEGLGAVQILLKDLPGGFSVAYAPYGPVAADTSNLAKVLASGSRYARQRGAYLFRIEPRWGVEANREILGAGSYVQAERWLPGCTLIVDIPEDPEEHFRSLPKDTRYGVRRAHREGVEVATLYKGAVSMYRGMDEFYELLKDTSRRQGFYVAPQAFYLNLMIDFPASAYLLLARYKGTAVAGALITTFGDEAYYLYGASTAEKGNLYAPYLVQWEAMDVARRAGCSRYDMWGVPRPSYSHSPGFYRFKKKFAGTTVEYAEASTRILSHLEFWEHGAIRLGAKGRHALQVLRTNTAVSKLLRS